MKPEIILFVVSALTILIGIWALYYSVRKFNPGHRPRKFTARLIRQALGPKGVRIFNMIMGCLFIILGVGLAFITTMKDSTSTNKKYARSDWIKVTTHSNPNDTILTKMDIERNKIAKMGSNHLKDYRTISFKSNGLKDIPDFVWHMKNLRILDLTNNNIEKIDQHRENFMKFEELTLIILSNNPMDSIYVKSINQAEGFYDLIDYEGILNK